MEDFQKIKDYCINPVESREASLDKPESLEFEPVIASEVEVLDRFIEKTPVYLRSFFEETGLAMSFEDLVYCQTYFRDTEKRSADEKRRMRSKISEAFSRVSISMFSRVSVSLW